MSIGPTIENLRKKRAEEAALIEQVLALPNRGTIEPRTPSAMEDVAAWFGDKIKRVGGDFGAKMDDRAAYRAGENIAGLLGFLPVTGTMMSGVQADRDIGAGNYGSAALNAGSALFDVATLGVGGVGIKALNKVGAATPARAAAETYMLRDRLATPSGYVGPLGRPSIVDIPDAGRFEARPISEIENAAREYMDARGMDSSPLREYAPVDPARAELIASAYDMMQHDPSNPMVRRAYDAMIQETMDQYGKLRDAGIDFRFLREGMDDPYARSPSLGYKDLIENGRLYVFPTDFGFGSSAAFDPSTNPLLKGVGRVGDKPDAVANDAFRAVHDAFGHFGSGNPFFRAAGEERAFQEHARMYSPEARGAMTSETRGQNSWLNYGPYGAQNRTALGADTIFADQKTGLLPPWAYDVYGMPDEDELTRLLRNRENWAR